MSQPTKPSINYSEAGRLGALALNSDPEKKSAAARKAAQTRKAKNPNAFSEMGRKGGANSRRKVDDVSRKP